MLLSFSVSGFGSIQQPIEMSLEPFYRQRISGTKYEKNYIQNGHDRVAKSVIIFGNNASGKTNLLLALNFSVNLIVGDILFNPQRKTRGRTLADIVKTYLNRFSEVMTFELEVADEKDAYKYAISLRPSGVLEESLTKNDRVIYEYAEDKLHFPGSGEIEEIYSVPSSIPLLHKLNDFIPDMATKFRGLIGEIEVDIPGAFNTDGKWSDLAVSRFGKQLIEQHQEQALAVLQTIDPTISEIAFQPISDADGEERYTPSYHRKRNGEDHIFPFAAESQGVKKITGLLVSLLGVLDDKRTFVVDEFDSSISTRSLLQIYRSLVHSDLNSQGQLIVTSHDLTLLDMDVFAASQVYVIYKTEKLGSVMHSLGDFNLRSDKKRLAMRFLRGDFEV